MTDGAEVVPRRPAPYTHLAMGVALSTVAALCWATAGGSEVAAGTAAAGAIGSLGLADLLIGSIALGIRLARSDG